MELFRYIRQRKWGTVLGYGFFVGMMAVGYYYNLTFVQLGLVNLGEHVIGMPDQRVALSMALLALVTCSVDS